MHEENYSVRPFTFQHTNTKPVTLPKVIFIPSPKNFVSLKEYLDRRLREAIRRKNLLPFGIFPKGGGSCPNPNVSSNFFVLFMFGHFSERGGGLPNTKLFEELFCLCLEIFQEREGGLPCSKNVEELFCLSLEIFQEERGGVA